MSVTSTTSLCQRAGERVSIAVTDIHILRDAVCMHDLDRDREKVKEFDVEGDVDLGARECIELTRA